MDAIINQLLLHLPPDLQAIIHHPPSLSDPSSFWPLIRAISPYARYIVILLAFYIVWTTLASIFGYFSRFVRFAMKIGPILGILAWIMAASGQGSVGDVFEIVKQWTGLVPEDAAGQLPPGVASLAGLFGQSTSASSRKRRKSSTSGSGSRYSARRDPASSRTRSKTGKQDSDLFSDILKAAVGTENEGGDLDWQKTTQSFVKRALAKAAGLGWLFGDDREL